VYARISSDRDNMRQGTRDQLQRCQDRCREQNWQIVGPYEDNNRTAADPDKSRPEYDRMLADARAGQFDRVVVSWADRLYRQPAELETFVTDMVAAGVTRVTVLHGDPDIDAVMMLRIMTAVAANYVEVGRVKMKDRKDQHAREGRSSGGPRAFGFERDRETVRESEAMLIREAADRVLSGETVYSIAKDWNRRGLPPVVRGSKRATGGWAPTTIARVLRAPRTTGLREHQGKVVGTATWAPILDRKTWERVCSTLKTTGRQTRQTTRSYLLRGIAVCECGRLLAGSAERKPYYRCAKSAKVGGKNGCGMIITAQFVDDYVTWLVCDVLDADGLTDVVHGETESVQLEIEQLVAENTADQAKLDKWRDDFDAESLPWDQGEYNQQARKVKARMAERTAKLGSIRSTSTLDTYAGRGKEWATWDMDTQRKVIGALIESVTIDKAARHGRGALTLDRIHVHWRYNALGPLIANLFETASGPQGAYLAAREHFPALAAFDAAMLEQARNRKLPARVRAGIAADAGAWRAAQREARKSAKV
jgi:site-specific DNA recombinase